VVTGFLVDAMAPSFYFVAIFYYAMQHCPSFRGLRKLGHKSTASLMRLFAFRTPESISLHSNSNEHLLKKCASFVVL
jgi:hypothetical protein